MMLHKFEQSMKATSDQTNKSADRTVNAIKDLADILVSVIKVDQTNGLPNNNEEVTNKHSRK